MEFDTVIKVEDIVMILSSDIAEHFQAALNMPELNCNMLWPNIVYD